MRQAFEGLVGRKKKSNTALKKTKKKKPHNFDQTFFLLKKKLGFFSSCLYKLDFFPMLDINFLVFWQRVNFYKGFFW